MREERLILTRVELDDHVFLQGQIDVIALRQGDVIGVKSTKKDIAIFKAAKEGSGRVVPKWLTTDLENLTATVAALPQRDDVDLTLQENMIVEFYSR